MFLSKPCPTLPTFGTSAETVALLRTAAELMGCAEPWLKHAGDADRLGAVRLARAGLDSIADRLERSDGPVPGNATPLDLELGSLKPHRGDVLKALTAAAAALNHMRNAGVGSSRHILTPVRLDWIGLDDLELDEMMQRMPRWIEHGDASLAIVRCLIA